MSDQIKICYITDRTDTNIPLLEAVEDASVRVVDPAAPEQR